MKAFWEGKWCEVLDSGLIGKPCISPTDAEKGQWLATGKKYEVRATKLYTGEKCPFCDARQKGALSDRCWKRAPTPEDRALGHGEAPQQLLCLEQVRCGPQGARHRASAALRDQGDVHQSGRGRRCLARGHPPAHPRSVRPRICAAACAAVAPPLCRSPGHQTGETRRDGRRRIGQNRRNEQRNRRITDSHPVLPPSSARRGRAPTAEDLIAPASGGKPRNNSYSWRVAPPPFPLAGKSFMKYRRPTQMDAFIEAAVTGARA